MIPSYVHLSDRKLPLVYTGKPLPVSVVTVENYCKWYTLFLVNPNGSVEAIDFPDVSATHAAYGAAFHDHVPNPWHVMAWAHAKGFHLDEQSLEMMIGRWETECLGEYEL